MVVPNDWKPQARMRRIHVHWTVGNYTANDTDKAHYHILIQGDGSLVRGDKSIRANEAGSGMTPASHTLNANTGAIGVSICSMVGAKENPFIAGPSPITRLQWEKMLEVVADLALTYDIPVIPTCILTHAEVQPVLRIKQKGKWDITRLVFEPKKVGHEAVGDFMRVGVAQVLDKLKGPSGPMPDELKLPRFKVAGVAPSTLNLRRSPAGEKVGELKEGTVVERIVSSGTWSQVRTPGGYVGWVSSAYLQAVGTS